MGPLTGDGEGGKGGEILNCTDLKNVTEKKKGVRDKRKEREGLEKKAVS